MKQPYHLQNERERDNANVVSRVLVKDCIPGLEFRNTNHAEVPLALPLVPEPPVCGGEAQGSLQHPWGPEEG